MNSFLSALVCENTFFTHQHTGFTSVGCVGEFAAEKHTQNTEHKHVHTLAIWRSTEMQLLSVPIQIDYQTFLTLSDEDLKEVGVSTFGARRKMLLAISGENLTSKLGPSSASPSVNVVGVPPPLVKMIKLFIFLFQTWTRARGGSRTHPQWSLATWRAVLVADYHELWI